MPEVIRYTKLTKQDLALGKGTLEVRLANGTVATLDEIDVGAILNDADVSTQALSLVSLVLSGALTVGGTLTLSGGVDLDGKELVLDEDGDTSLQAGTDDEITVKIGGTSVTLARSGNAWVFKTSDTRTNSVDVGAIVQSVTSGTPAAGIGTGLQFDAEGTGEDPMPVGRLDFLATDVADGSEDTVAELLVRVAGAALAPAYRFAATTANKATVTHANTANRTYTLPDATTTLLGTDTTATVSNKTLDTSNTIQATTFVTPTISGAAPATPVANRLYTDSVIKGWVVFQVDGTIDDDVNVSSVTDGGAGTFTVNWATAFASANYTASVTGTTNPGQFGIWGTVDGDTDPTTTALKVLTKHDGTSGQSDPEGTRPRVHVIAIGDQ